VELFLRTRERGDPVRVGKRGQSSGMGRKQGGQAGHSGHGRALFPIERVSEVADHWPQRCSYGQAELSPLGVATATPSASGSAAPSAAAPPARTCLLACRGTASAPKLEAVIASLTVRNRLSRRQLVELFGCPIAVGTIDRRRA
jgi:hypothetical protein